MTVRADSYGTAADVQAFTQHLMSGQAAYNSTTRPTLAQVEEFINRCSGHLNIALAGAGFAVPVTNSTAVLMLSDWVIARTCEYVELTQRGAGYNDSEQSRTAGFRGLFSRADNFVRQNARGLRRLGCAVTHRASDGLAYTGLSAPADRADPDNTGLAQPAFRRGLFDDDSTEE